jgi:peptidoglycan/LPS O-acetylase OafA/YrhL
MTALAATETKAVPPLQREGGNRRIGALDGLRAIAVLLVVVNHLVLAVPLPWGRVQRLLYSGWIGVDLFFVLSGYLITGILLDAKGGSHYFRNFYARRTLRIFPLYYGVLIVAIIAISLGAPQTPMLRLQGWLWGYATNIKIAASGWMFMAGRWQFNHFWTLAVEEQFYLAWPAVVLLLSRRSLLWVCAAVFVLSPALRIALCLKGNTIAAYVLTPCQLDALTNGAALAILVRSPAGLRLLRKVLLPAALLCLVPLAYLVVRHGGLDQNLMNKHTVSLGSTLLAAALCGAIWLAASGGARFLSVAPLASVGRISYGIYVLHPFCLELVPKHLFARSPVLSLIAFYLIGLSLSIAAATLSWHLFEKHFLRLKRAFPRTQQHPRLPLQGSQQPELLAETTR